MTKYLQGSFSVGYGGDDYAKGWEETFGKRCETTKELISKCTCETHKKDTDSKTETENDG